MLKQIKLLTLYSLKRTGIFSLVEDSGWRRQRLLILAYHGISLDDEHQWNPPLYMTPGQFATRLELLKKYDCAVLPLGEALRRLYAGDLPERSVAITFDDGTYDFYKHAYPLLRDFDFPVSLYLTTFYCNYNRPVFDGMCAYLLWKGKSERLNLKEVTGQEVNVELSTAASRAVAFSGLRQFARLNNLSAEEKDRLLVGLAKQLRVDYDAIIAKRIVHILKPGEVRELAEAGVDVQLHTHRHRTPMDQGLFIREIEDNRDQIQRIVGSRANHFCYPSGVHDAAFLPWLTEAGVESATTCDPGIATRNSHPLLLPRLVDSSALSSLEFEGWVAGVANALPQRPSTTKTSPP